ncbi:MAG: isoleucine--tRNA ligase [Phycisphaerales bacterium]|nr:isoleucine--tRNA ligase [Phycisphaerales bacterium]
MSSHTPTTNSNPTPPPTPTPTPQATAPTAKSYKDTLNLPKTSFPMKANLVQNEPASLKRWNGISGGVDGAKGLYEATRAARKGAAAFSFHDGPPYANGDIHMGHLMNKCLKDFVVRTRTMMGMDCAYVPGWDCHGLPIEHKVMQELVESGKAAKLAMLTDDQRKMAVRRECQKYAEKYVKLQAGQMERLLTLADYAHPYLTMSSSFEGATLEVLAELVEQGLVYRALKPVHWSIANETALAEAELEYQDREDLSVYVDFEALDADAVYGAFGLGAAVDEEDDDEEESSEKEDAVRVPVKPGVRPNVKPSFMIWTTTPWTLPANVGVAVNPKIEYALVWMDGAVSVLASGLVEKVAKMAKVERPVVLGTTTGDKLIGLRYRHPFVEHPPACGLGRKCDAQKLWSVVAAEYVTTEDGTGLVHTAPGHGEEDYATGLREGLPVYSPVKDNGTYDHSAPEWLRGISVWEANKRVTEWLQRSGHLFFDHTFTHSYPHDWRSKTPVIFRCTEQWFVSVNGPHHTAFRGPKSRSPEKVNLREMALEAVREEPGSENRGAQEGKVNFVPEWGRNRMRGMLDSRPDWCISRQRAWGLPIPAFLTPTGGVLMTAMSVRSVARVVREKGSDAWFMAPPEELLKYYDPKSDPDPQARHVVADGAHAGVGQCAFTQLKKGNDILDVWFESGSSWNSCVRERGLGYPIDLYLEGSDQHRGWFQLSLLPALGVTGRPPFKTLLTHGFMVDKNGKKMSKSLGNDIKVEELLRDHGADVCRWWVASLSYENDVKVDMEFFALAGESYRKIRNTLRFMLSNLDDFVSTCEGKAGHCVDLKRIAPTSLDAWVLGSFDALSATVREAYARYDFKAAQEALYNFCNDTLSAVYLAAVKDRLYCDKPDSARRRQAQTVLWDLTDGLCRLLAPVLCHTADEAYRALCKVDPKDAHACVHLKTFINSFGVTPDEAWPLAIAAVDKATKALEQAKQAMGVENPLDAGVVLPDADGVLARFDPVDLADLIGVSRVTLDAKASAARIEDLRGQPRCERSWKRDGTVRARSDGGMLSDRDAAAIGVG